MRYIKVFIAVIFFFVVMMFFVQNQEVFSQKVSLNLDLIFTEPLMTSPIPLYSLLLISFAVGALLILAMLMWDRVSLSTKLTLANRKINALNKKLELAFAAESESRKALSDVQTKLDESKTSIFNSIEKNTEEN